MSFRRFIAVDWSGAKKPGYTGVAVAECKPGRAAPRLVCNPRGRHWRRSDVRDWLSDQIATDGPVLIGLDFAFALPWNEDGGYFPGSGVELDDAPVLWRLVDEVCADSERGADLYAGPFIDDERFGRFFWNRGPRPPAFGEGRLRMTEKRCKPPPECVFKLIGPKQVGKASLSGMRLLHGLKAGLGEAVKVWPFEPVADGKSVCVDIFPRIFIARAGMGTQKIRELCVLNEVLEEHYESNPVAKDEEEPSDHDTDALVSAAALRGLAGNEGLWRPEGMTADVARREGWIFGVA